LRRIRVLYNRFLSPNKIECQKICEIVGFTPSNLKVFQLALRHSSSADQAINNNERLEYLGDAILDTIISDYLFRIYPIKGEGFLTEMRSKIVSRKMLGQIGNQLGLADLLEYNKDHVVINNNIIGNALEALIGAIFLDAGYHASQKFVMSRMVRPFIDLEEIQQTEVNHKSKLLEWSQKFNRTVSFELLSQQVIDGNNRVFTVMSKVDGKKIAIGKGKNKKAAQKDAARIAVERLGISIE